MQFYPMLGMEKAMSIRGSYRQLGMADSRIGEVDTGKSYSQYHSRVGCVDKRWLSTGGIAEEDPPTPTVRDSHSTPATGTPTCNDGWGQQRWYDSEGAPVAFVSWADASGELLSEAAA